MLPTVNYFKPIPPNVHGVLDYASVLALIVLSLALRLPRGVARLLQASALFSLAYSLVTRYRFSLVKLLSMRTHLGLDLTSATVLMAGPDLLHVRERRLRWLLHGLALYETVVPLLTRTGKDSG